MCHPVVLSCRARLLSCCRLQVLGQGNAPSVNVRGVARCDQAGHACCLVPREAAHQVTRMPNPVEDSTGDLEDTRKSPQRHRDFENT